MGNANNGIIRRPQGSHSQYSGSNQLHPLWQRLAAFLSMRAPNTQITYKGILKEWCEFLGTTFGSVPAAEAIISATDMAAMAYRHWLDDQPGETPRYEQQASSDGRELEVTGHGGAYRPQKKEGLESTMSNATIAKKLAGLRRMYRLFVSADLGVNSNPFDSDKVPPPPKDSGRKRPTEMVPFEQVMKVVDSVDIQMPKGLRDRAILAVLFGGGLRRSEVSRLRLGDVKKTKEGTLFVHLRSTKAKKDADQALPGWAAELVMELVQSRLQQGAKAGDFLYICYSGQAGQTPTPKPVSVSGIYKLFKLYCGLAGVPNFVSPHSARATAITRLLDEGIPHREVKEFSRHSSIQMVEVYDKRRIGVDQNPAKFLKY